MYCKHCRQEIADDSKFCQHCGGCQLESIETDDTSKESAPLFIVKKKNWKGENKFGIISSLGRVILPCVYNEINWVSQNSVYIVKKTIHSYSSEDDNYEAYGLYDHMGHEIIGCNFDKIELEDNLVIVTKQGGYGVISYTGEYLIPMQKHSIYKLDETYYAVGCFVMDKEGVFYIMKKKDGEMFHTYNLKHYFKNTESFSLVNIPKEYQFPLPLSDNFIICKKRDDSSRLLGLINVDGNVMLPFEFYSILLVHGTNNIFQVEKYKDGTSDIYKYNELIGKMAKIYNGDYESIRVCEHSADYFIAISQEHKYGLISVEGSVIIPCKYNYIYMPNAMFVVLRNGDYDFYSIEEKQIVLKNISDYKLNEFFYCNISKKESQWIPYGDKRQIAIAVQKDGLWQIKNADFVDRGRRLYDNVTFESYGVIGEYGLYQDIYDCYGNFKKCFKIDPEYPEIDDDDDGPSWEELGKDEEDYIINNGGDWILDNG